jgi:hypothetical protein
MSKTSIVLKRFAEPDVSQWIFLWYKEQGAYIYKRPEKEVFWFSYVKIIYRPNIIITYIVMGDNQNQCRWGRLTDEIKWKWQKELEQLQTGTVRNLPFVVLLSPNQKKTNACSSLISGSERPDSQANSARKAGWSFPIV